MLHSFVSSLENSRNMHDGNLLLSIVVGLPYVLAYLPVHIFVLDFSCFLAVFENIILCIHKILTNQSL